MPKIMLITFLGLKDSRNRPSREQQEGSAKIPSQKAACSLQVFLFGSLERR